jgi:hypothetical protein
MLNLRAMAGHLEISETELSINCCARCIQRYDQVVVPVCDSIFDEEGKCLRKCGYCSQQRGYCVPVGVETESSRCADFDSDSGGVCSAGQSACCRPPELRG